MTLIVLIMSCTVFLAMFIMALKECNKQLERYVKVMTGTNTERAIDEFFKKAVMISVDSYRNDKAEGVELEKKIIERASVIVSDVLLQHGFPPRQFNLEGCCKVAMAKLGIIKLRKVVITNGKS